MSLMGPGPQSPAAAAPLLSLLKEKGLVNELCAGENVSASDFSVFGVEMSLTEEGDTRVEEIIGRRVGQSVIGFGREQLSDTALEDARKKQNARGRAVMTASGFRSASWWRGT